MQGGFSSPRCFNIGGLAPKGISFGQNPLYKGIK